jgi:hypothetical protein
MAGVTKAEQDKADKAKAAKAEEVKKAKAEADKVARAEKEAKAQRRADVERAIYEGANPKGFSAENAEVYREILAEEK